MQSASLHRILESAIRDRTALTLPVIQSKPERILWRASRFGLDRSSVYRKLDLDQQSEILKKLTQNNLGLSYFIEKAGQEFCARMILSAETDEEMGLYSMFAAEEAMHMQCFLPYLAEIPDSKTFSHPLLPPLWKVLSTGSRPAMVFIAQVLLEGFGIHHYHQLKISCMSASFQDALNLILRDEAKHHGSGLVLTQAVTVTAEMKDEMFEYTRQFVMATQGANWAMQALEAVRGELSNVHKQQFLEETNYLQLQQQRKLKLMEMIQKSDRFGITERLVKEGV